MIASKSQRASIVLTFDELATRDPWRILVQCESGKTSAGEISSQSQLIKNEIIAHRLSPGSVIGLLARNGSGFLAGFLGIRRAGCTALLLDRSAPSADRRRTLERIGAHAVLSFPRDTDTVFNVHEVGAQGKFHRVDKRPDRALIKMTSGSIGNPSGIAVDDETLLADEDALSYSMGLREDDRLVATIPMSHSYGFTTLALSALARGRTLITTSQVAPLASLVAAKSFRATVFPTVPAYIKGLLALSNAPDWPKSIRLFLAAGAPLSPVSAKEFRKSSGRPIHIFYGASECGGICFDRSGDAAERGTVGTPVEGVTISISEDDDTVERGELIVQSNAVGETYLPNSSSRLENNRFQTGDLAVWRSGEIELLGRADRAEMIRGYKVNPAEIENVLLEIPEIDEVVVLGIRGSEDADTFWRVVIACESRTLTAVDVTKWCMERLPTYKVPRSIFFVDRLPRNERGKIDRPVLMRLSN